MKTTVFRLIATALSIGASASIAESHASPGNTPYKLRLGGAAEYRLASIPASRQIAPHAKRYATRPSLDGKPYAREIAAAALKNGLDPTLLHALIHVESRHRQLALSAKGAIGLMQVLPETAQRVGINNPKTPTANLEAGSRYLRFLLDTFDQRLDLALAAYNAGEGAVIRYRWQIPPYRETRDYVPAVMAKYEEWLGDGRTGINYLAGTRLSMTNGFRPEK